MEATEVTKLATFEERHWWFRERRVLLDRFQRGFAHRGLAIDVGAAGGGNTRVLQSNGWNAVALEYGGTGAAICRERGLPTVRGDATQLPFASACAELAVAFDIIEHIEDDGLAVREMRRVLKFGGTLLLAVPADPALWSAHDVAVDHVRRYTRSTLGHVISENGFRINEMRSWNVLMKPVAKLRRKHAKESDIEDVSPVLNSALSAVIRIERYLPVSKLPGVSLMVVAEAC